MNGWKQYALTAALAALLAAPSDASAGPSAKNKPKDTSAQTKRKARSAVPTRRPRRPRSLTRSRRDLAKLPPVERMSEELRKVWSGRTLRRSTTAVYIADAHTGEVLFAVHEDERLNPASNVKLISTATVLDTLGSEYRYLTRLYGPTPNRDGVAQGDLYLLGNFDPTLSVAHLDELAEALAAAGVKRVSGDILIGTGARRDGVSNPRVTIEVTATTPGEPPEVAITPSLDFIELEVTAVTTKKRRARLRVSTERIQADPSPEPEPETEPTPAPDRLKVTVRGKIRAGRNKTYSRWVPQRAQLTAQVTRQALLDAGIRVDGTVAQLPFEEYVAHATRSARPFLPVELARHESAPLGELVAKVNKRSINWLADHLVKTAGAAAFGGAPDMHKGVLAMQQWLQASAGIDKESFQLDTGSGLSYKTELTAKHIVRVLRTAAGYALDDDAAPAPPGAQVFRESLSIAGRDGTLRRRFRKSKIRDNLIGKTGTLTRIIALAGVLATDDDNALCFAIVTNDHRRGYRRRVKREHESMVKAMYRFLQQRKPATATASK